MSLKKELLQHTHGYVCKGGTKNRKQQRARMLAFTKHAKQCGAFTLSNIGAGHVISYWKLNRSLADSTLYNHWLAIREVWKFAGKSGEPPEPKYKKTKQN